VYELAPILAVAVLAALLGGATGAGLAVRWLVRRRWRFDSMARSWEHEGETFSAGTLYAHPDDDEPGPDGELPLP
jgi:hypothetical protein